MNQDSSSQHQPDPVVRTLNPKDAEALDALLEARTAGLESGPMPPDSRERTEQIRQLLNLLGTDNPDDQVVPDQLRADTLQAVRDARRRAQFSRQVEQLTGSGQSAGGFPVSWRQVLAASIVLILGGSILLPMLQSNNAAARRQICLTNLAAAGQAFANYAGDHQGVLPQATAPAAASATSSASLYRMISGQYLEPRQLACPENEFFDRAVQADIQDDNWSRPELVSYSYHNGHEPVRLNDWSKRALLADRNPLYKLTANGYTFDASIPATTSSTIHHETGQNVLQADGHASWWTTPLLDDQGHTDNIWIPNAALTPANAYHDSVLTP